MARFALQQKPRNDAGDPAAALEGGVGEQAHQADATAAIDQRYAFTGQQFAQPDGNIAGRRIGAEAGAAEDAEGGGDGNGHGCFFLQAIRCLSGPGGHGIISQREVATPMAVGSRTIGRVMSRTVLWLMAAGAIVIAAAVGVAWRGKLSRPGRSGPGQPGPARTPGVGARAVAATMRASRIGARRLNPRRRRRPTQRRRRPRRWRCPSFDVARIGPGWPGGDRRTRARRRQDRAARWRQGDRPRPGRCQRRMGHPRPGAAADAPASTNCA